MPSLLSKTRNGILEPYPDAPTIAWFIANRVADTIVERDCMILFRGPKGSSKSTSSIGLLAGIAYEFQKMGLGPWWLFFNVMTHVKTIDPSGTLDLFTKNIIKRKNSCLLADDVSISADSRNAMSSPNKQLTQIITVSRIYQDVVVMNSVYSKHVDKRLTQFADIIIDMIGVHRKSKKAVGQVYWYEVNQFTGEEYIKYFRWKKKRIKYSLFPLPPDFLIAPYKQMRKDKTDAFLGGIDDIREGRVEKKQTARQIRVQKIFQNYYEPVVKLRREGKAVKAILGLIKPVDRDTFLTEYWIKQILAEAGLE